MRAWGLIVSLLFALPTILAAPRAMAETYGDCPPIGTLDNFEASAQPSTRTYEAMEFRVVEGGTAKTITKEGKTCVQHYALKSGAPRTTNLEIMRNYAEGLPALGMKITNTNRADDDEIYATIVKDGIESWVHVWSSNGDGLHVQTVQVEPFKPTLAPLGDKDCPPIQTLLNFEPAGPPDTRVYSAVEFRVVKDGKAETVTKTGASCLQHYARTANTTHSSDLEIMKNYAVALPALGMTITNTNRSDDDEIFATMTKDGVETWAHVWPSNGDAVHIQTVRIEPFKPTVAPLTGKDCPPVPPLRDFAAAADRPDTRTYDRIEFRVSKNGNANNVAKTGKTCTQHYTLNGARTKTNLEIIKNYAVALPALGMTITNADRSDDDEIFATMTKDGVETWVHVWASNGDAIAVKTLLVEPFKPTVAPLTGKDCPPVPPLLDFAAAGPPETRPFDKLEFRVVKDGNANTVTKTGKTCVQHYVLKDGVPNKTDLEIIKNYETALPATGLTITNTNRSDEDEIFAAMSKDGVETWVHVWPSNDNAIAVQTLRIEPFKSTLKAAQVVEAPKKTALKVTAMRGGQPLAGAWCGIFAPGKQGGDPVAKANSGVVMQADPGSYDVGCFITEDGATHAGWLKAQTLASGSAELAIDLPAPPVKRAEIVVPIVPPAAQPEQIRLDRGDFPYLPSVPGSMLTGGRADPAPFFVQPADAKQPELVANGSIVKEYQSPAGVGLAQLLGAYKMALLRAHWTIVNEFNSNGIVLMAHYGDNGRNIWAILHLTQAAYTITVADATGAQARLAADLGSKCHAALTGVLFDFDKSTLKPVSDPVLQSVVVLMVKDPAAKFEIQGHTDNVGSDAYNQPLSEARARAVVTWLVQHNVASNRLTARGYGKTRPVVTNDTDAGRAQNRRVEIANPACKG